MQAPNFTRQGGPSNGSTWLVLRGDCHSVKPEIQVARSKMERDVIDDVSAREEGVILNGRQEIRRGETLIALPGMYASEREFLLSTVDLVL